MDRKQLARTYIGEKAELYDSRRSRRPKWRWEHAAFLELISVLDKGSEVLDVPVGTGRFIGVYKEKLLKCTGLDASADMLSQAERKCEELKFEMKLTKGSIFDLPFESGRFDCVVCVRFLNWLNKKDLSKALLEVSRCSRRYVIISIRTKITNERILKDLPWKASYWIRGVFSRKQSDRRAMPHESEDFELALVNAGLEAIKEIKIPSGRPYTSYRLILCSKI